MSERQLITEHAHPASLMRELTMLIGPDVYELEPETLYLGLAKRGIQVPSANVNRIEAMRTLNNNSLVGSSWPLFEKVVVGINGLPVRFDLVQPLEIGELVFGVNIIRESRPGLRFISDVPAYIAATLKHWGAHAALPPLHFVSTFMTEPELADPVDMLLTTRPARVDKKLEREYWIWYVAREYADYMEAMRSSDDQSRDRWSEDGESAEESMGQERKRSVRPQDPVLVPA